MSVRHYTLYELNTLVRQTLEIDMPGDYWVEAELSEVREVRGHCYMELVQTDVLSALFPDGGRHGGAAPVARASAKCWQTRWRLLRPRFEQVTGQPLRPGMQVLLQVSPNFHEAYGFSWIVSDIDPTFTLGDMARRRQEIIRTLKEEGVFDLQKELMLSPFARRVAVVSSENAAGYGDFCNQLADNEYGFSFQTRLFPAVMQGELVEQTVIAALDSINDELEEFDVVVIIRGGGATADLSGFDTLALAENVANFPLPIITGIGHDRDESVLDMISHTRVKTPTAAAAFLVDHLLKTWQRIERAQESILNRIGEQLRTEQLRLAGMEGRIPVIALSVVGNEQLRLRRLQERLTSGVPTHLQTMRHRIETLSAAVMPLVERRMMTERHRLELFEQRMKALDPALLLRRGYSITLKDGHAVRSAEELRPGDVIETRIEKGTIKSIVQ
ncbi:MAG: exodeoxyribonuclease VII large subunit [Prevotella sp.]|nr:exodeoxyribonuclease VII large subunit [Prevotella sp.]